MDTKKVIYFLNMLRSETTGRDAELNQLYGAAISEDEDVVQLDTFLNDYNFYSGVGRTLHDNGSQLIDKLRANPYDALQTMQSIQQMNEMIANEASLCSNLLRSPEPFSDNITVLPKKDTMDHIEALKQTANAAAYLMILYGGMSAIKDLTWPTNAGLQEYIYTVNTKYLNKLMEIKRPGYSWVIRKKKLGGRALFSGDYFYLNYESNRSVEVLCSALHKEPIGTHAFLNINAYEADEIDVPYCWGIGNLISTTPSKALSFLQADVVTTPRSPSASELSRKIPTPIECLRILTDQRPFCITPDELVSAMNQWQMGHEFYLRKKNGRCLFCGRMVDRGAYVCPSHFTTEF